MYAHSQRLPATQYPSLLDVGCCINTGSYKHNQHAQRLQLQPGPKAQAHAVYQSPAKSGYKDISDLTSKPCSKNEHKSNAVTLYHDGADVTGDA